MIDKVKRWLQSFKHEATVTPSQPEVVESAVTESIESVEPVDYVESVEPVSCVPELPESVEQPAASPSLSASPAPAATAEVKQRRHSWNWLGVEGYNKRKAWRDRQKEKKAAAAEVAKKDAVEKFVAEQDAGVIKTQRSLIETMELEREAALLRQQQRIAEPVVEPAAVQAIESEPEPVLSSVEPLRQIVEPAPVEETPLQKLQREYAAQCAAQHEQDTRAVNWSDEIRKDLPMRTPGRIRFLIEIEAAESLRRRLPPDRLGTPALTVARIQNDIDRSARIRKVGVDPGQFMVRPGSDGLQKVW